MTDEPPIAERIELEYARPVVRRGLVPLWVGIMVSVMLSIGCGCVVMGTMVGGLGSSDRGTFLAIGVSLLVLGPGILASFVLAKR